MRQKRRGEILIRFAPSSDFLKIRLGIPDYNLLIPNRVRDSEFSPRFPHPSGITLVVKVDSRPSASLVADSVGGHSLLLLWKISLPLFDKRTIRLAELPLRKQCGRELRLARGRIKLLFSPVHPRRWGSPIADLFRERRGRPGQCPLTRRSSGHFLPVRNPRQPIELDVSARQRAATAFVDDTLAGKDDARAAAAKNESF